MVSPCLHGATWIVDDDYGPGVDFTDIPPAIAAASPGDLILVRDGSYSPVILDKPLSLVSDTGCHPNIVNSAKIFNISPNQSVVFSGFSLKRLFVHKCKGSVLVDDCDIGFSEVPYEPSLKIDGCDQVAISRTNVKGKDASYYKLAASFTHSTVVVTHCDFVGGKGEDGHEISGENGGFGVYAHTSKVFFQASCASGGDGGDNTGLSGIGGNGAPGIAAYYAYVEVFGLPDHTIRGGAGGDSATGSPGIDSGAISAWESTINYSGVSLVVEPGAPLF